jgi:hypothetical protein
MCHGGPGAVGDLAGRVEPVRVARDAQLDCPCVTGRFAWKERGSERLFGARGVGARGGLLEDDLRGLGRVQVSVSHPAGEPGRARPLSD